MTERKKPDCWPNHFDCDHRKYIGLAVTLNGQPAKIVKDSEGYASIVTLNPEAHGSVHFSWTTIFNVCNNRDSQFQA